MKLIKIKLNILINSKELKQTLNLTTVLGQQGINLIKFNGTLEPFLNILKYKLPLNIQIKVFNDKTFDLIIKNFNFNYIFKHFLFLKKKYNIFYNYIIDDTFNQEQMLLLDNDTSINFLNFSEEFLNFKYHYQKIQITPFDLFVFHNSLKFLEKENIKNFSIMFSNFEIFKKIVSQIKTCYRCFVSV